MASAARQKLTRYQKIATSAISEHSGTLTKLAIDHQEFGRLCSEALLNTPDILTKVNEPSFAKAIRQACLQGLVPNGIDAAIVPRKGSAVFWPMEGGLKKIAIRCLPDGAQIQSGIIYEGDEVQVTQLSGQPMKISVCSNPFNKNDDQIIGAWATLKVGEQEYTSIVSQQDIAKLKKIGLSEAWKVWPERMVRKSVVKRLLREHRYLIEEASPQGEAFTAAMEDPQDIDPVDGGTLEVVEEKEPEPQNDEAPPWHEDEPPPPPEPPQETPPKKRRGRPPKNTPLEPATDAVEAFSDSDDVSDFLENL